MPAKHATPVAPSVLLHELIQSEGRIATAARNLGVSRPAFYDYLALSLGKLGLKDPNETLHTVVRYARTIHQTAFAPLPDDFAEAIDIVLYRSRRDGKSRLYEGPTLERDIRPGKRTKRFVVTTAQADASVDEEAWETLKTVLKVRKAELIVMGYTYAVTGQTTWRAPCDGHYDPRIADKMAFGRIQIGDVLVMSDLNTLPTRKEPLAALDTHSKGQDAIFPHVKMQMKTVPSMVKGEAAHLYTTGAITKPLYVWRRAGVEAYHHHIIGALLVELDPDGTTFVRQLEFNSDGQVQDLDDFFSGTQHRKARVESLVVGDAHFAKFDPVAAAAIWGEGFSMSEGSIVDVLKPREQFIHDAWDFEERNHHRLDDQQFWTYTHARGLGSVLGGLEYTLDCIDAVSQVPDCTTNIVASNHDHAVDKWVTGHKFLKDPENIEFGYLVSYLRAKEGRVEGERRNTGTPTLRRPTFAVLAEHLRPDLYASVRFLSRHESFTIHNIEHALHGDIGTKGQRGSPRTFARIVEKTTYGDKHGPTILDGAWGAGIGPCALDHGYNVGPSDWSHLHVVLYETGNRGQIRVKNGRWRATA